MKLTTGELRLVERLRKQERQWRFTRWLLALGGVILMGLWAWMLWRVLGSTDTPTDVREAELVRALAYPKVLFGMAVGAAMIGLATRDWVGRPPRILLLRLLEDHQSQDPPAPETTQAVPRCGASNNPPDNTPLNEQPR